MFAVHSNSCSYRNNGWTKKKLRYSEETTDFPNITLAG
jgi:hypothetical protein